MYAMHFPHSSAWWRHQMETFSAFLAICAGNSPVPGEFPAQRPVTQSFDVFVDLRLNQRLSKQSWGWWFETLPRPLLRHCNEDCFMGPWIIVWLSQWQYNNPTINRSAYKHNHVHIAVKILGMHYSSDTEHYSDVIMIAMASQITGVSIVRPTVCSGADQRKHQSSASLAFVRGIHRWPVNSPRKGPVMRKMFPFDDVIMKCNHMTMSCYENAFYFACVGNLSDRS